ncbi:MULTISPECIES: DNA ligase D [Phyllobacterium]|uniref:DNA ligase D n=1 Tax=Phyllobacterium TaxID=28100 RepID=UPI001CBFFD67|nr:DNA ligase D [Phyllobacterium calauticae]MBZ3695420.1 DNA ligase D [Phyllobacterium calauticae]
MAVLETYRQKRDFAKTREPKGSKARKSGNSFVIQKHDATRLHYDLRLEMDGVMKSWAITRGPSLMPSEKRLAVHVEDHPIEYNTFEGTIPKGEYGGGTVIIWDKGYWTPVDDAAKGYRKGHLEFELHGEKLHGRWHLVRMQRRPKEKRENWLLIKSDDDAARKGGEPDILEERPESVKSGREIDDVAGQAPGWSSKTGKINKKKKETISKKPRKSKIENIDLDPSKLNGAKTGSLPRFVVPALATLSQKPPVGDQWIHEIKFDGYRLQAHIQAGNVKLFTRSGLDWTAKFGKQLTAAFQALPIGNALIDGELIVETASGASDFSALQVALSNGETDHFRFYAFDLLYLDGYNIKSVPLIGRKALLQRIIGVDAGLINYSDHFDEAGHLVLSHACRLSLEGIVSKLRDAPYPSGRGKTWIKSKCSLRQEFVIAGFTSSSTSRKAIGSLVLGVYAKGKLQHVGRVGTGFTTRLAEELFRQLSGLRIDKSPFAERLDALESRNLRFIRPVLVADVEFRGWTADGSLRHASFRGLREDKRAKDVVRETPKMYGTSKQPKRTVTLTHPDRIYWPDAGVTKEGLADYYTEVWRYIEPFVVGRPLALLRGPSGTDSQLFFQKHAWKGLNEHIDLIKDPKEKSGEPLISINDLDGLIALVQSAVLEIHPWGSTVKDWEHPDMIVMDLDPGPEVEWQAVIDAALETKTRLEQFGLAPFVKTSGGKGLHVVAPLLPKATWPAVKTFTKAVAEAMATDAPDRYVATVTKSKRQGKILIDYLRNQRGATAVAPYSTRARSGAPVSMPLDWGELDLSIGPAYFTVNNAVARIGALSSDPWQDFRKSAKPLPAAKTMRMKG